MAWSHSHENHHAGDAAASEEASIFHCFVSQSRYLLCSANKLQVGFFDSFTSENYELNPLLWRKYLMLQTSLLVYLSIPNSFLLPLLQRLPPASALQTVPDSTATPTQPALHRQPPAPAPAAPPTSKLQNLVTDRGIGGFSVYKRFSCTFPHWILSFTVESSTAGRANEERVPPASHSPEMGTEKSNMLDCSRQMSHNQSLTKTMKVRSFQVNFFYYSVDVWWKHSYVKHHFSKEFSPITSLCRSPDWRITTSLRHHHRPFHCSMQPAFLSQIPPSSPENIGIKSHDKALL